MTGDDSTSTIFVLFVCDELYEKHSYLSNVPLISPFPVLFHMSLYLSVFAPFVSHLFFFSSSPSLSLCPEASQEAEGQIFWEERGVD